MKICYIAPANNVHTTRWLHAFVEQGCQVHLITLPEEQALIKGVQVHRLPDGPHTIRFLKWIGAARAILQQVHPDVLHGHYLTRYGWLAACTFFSPLVLTAWGSDIYLTPHQSPFWRWLTTWSLRRAELVTVDAADLRQAVIRLGVRTERVCLVQWGVDLGVFHPDLNTSILREQLHVQDKLIILSTRNLMPIYNQETIIRALPAVLAQVPNTVLILKYRFYDDSYIARIRTLVQNLGLEHAIRWVGPDETATNAHDDMAMYYAMADVFVSVALSDSTPVSLLEAMACGAAPVIGDLPALHEWIDHKQNGYLVPPTDAEALGRAITDLLVHPEQRAQWAHINRQIVQERANHWSEMARMKKLYENLGSS